jgi:hypothetical protein
MAETIRLWKRSISPSGSLNLPAEQYRPQAEKTQFLNTAADAAFDLATKYKEKEYYAQLNAAQAETLNRINNHFLTLQTNPDPTSYEKLFEDTLKKTKDELTKQLTNRTAAERYSQWLDVAAARWRGHNGKLIQHISERNMRDSYKLALSKYAVTIANAATPELRQQAINQLHKDTLQQVSTNLISEAEAEMDFDSVVKKADEMVREKNKQNLNQFVLDMAAADGWNNTLNWLSDPKNLKAAAEKYGIDTADYDKVFSDIKTQAAFKKNLADQALYQQREADTLKIVKALKDGSYTDDIVMNSSLDAAQKFEWMKKAADFAKEVNDKKSVNFTQSDPKIQLDVLTKINTGKNITPAEIMNLAGKGLSIKDADDYVAKLQARHTSPYSQTAKFLLDDMKSQADAGYFIYGQDEAQPDKEANLTTEQFLENYRIFTAIQNEFTNWLDNNPDATDKQILDKYKSLMEPSQNEIALNWWSRLFNFAAAEQEIRNRKQWKKITTDNANINRQIKIQMPDGKIWDVPEDKADAAISRGGKKLNAQ